MENSIKEKIRQRRAAMEMTFTSESGSFVSNFDKNDRSKNDEPSGRNHAMEKTVIDVSNEDVTNIQTLNSKESDEDDMLGRLKTRRIQWQNEFGHQGSWTQPSTPVQDVDDSMQTLSSHHEQFDNDEKLKDLSSSSIKEKRRRKVRAGKARTPQPAKEEFELDDAPERRLRGLRSGVRVTRFEKAQDEQFTNNQDGYSSPTLRQKSAGSSRLKQKAIPSNEDAYQFFTGTLDINERRLTEQDIQPPVDTGVELCHSTGDVIEEPFIFDDGQLTFYGKDPYVPNATRLNMESELYFMPSLLPANMSKKIPQGSVPRYLENEGFYVGKPTSISLVNLNIMENRILGKDKENDLWFGEDAKLKRLPDPLREKSTRPLMMNLEDLDPNLKTQWTKAEISGFDDRFIDRSGEKWYQIDVDISSLSFTHHPLFSKEHVLQSRLKQLYNNYCRRKKQAISSHLDEKLGALKTAVKQCYEAAKSHSSSSLKEISLPDDLFQRICSYKAQIRETRKQRDAESLTDRTLLTDILECWQEIKQIREQLGYVNTSCKLFIFREVTSRENERVEYERELQEEFEERREDFQKLYLEQMEEYKVKLKKWKKQKKLKKRRTLGEEDIEQNELFDDISEFPPEQPTKFNDEEEFQFIVDKAEKTRRKPGEPILTPELKSSANVTALEQCPRSEQQRRKDVQNWKAFVKVLFNNKEVSRTSTKSLLSDFTIHFGEIHPVKILQWPESIKLQLYENVGLQTKLLTEVFIPVPDINKVSGMQAELVAVEFSSTSEVVYHHDGVGSGFTISVRANNESSTLPLHTYLTSGTIYCNVSWGLDFEGKPLVPAQTSTSPKTAYGNVVKYDAFVSLGASGIMDIHALARWIAESNLDPNDPANAPIISLVKLVSDDTDGGPKYFRLHQLEDETRFVDDLELKNNKRFRILQLRNQLVPEFRNLKAIPHSDKDIPDDIFQNYEKRINGVEEDESKDDLSVHRATVTKFLNKVREMVIARSLIAKRQRCLSDMVVEEEVPNVGSLRYRIAQLLSPRRPLKPIRRERKTVGTQSLSQTNVRILVNVVRAFDIPVRISRPQTASSERPMETSEGLSSMFISSDVHGEVRSQNRSTGTRLNSLNEPMVQPFVEVVFQGNFFRTSVAHGPNPCWNEELTLPFRPPNDDYSPSSLQSVNDVIYLNIFDQVVVDINQVEQQHTTNIHQRLERHWLGSVELPFSTVYFNTKVDGTFRINMPAVLLGYQHNPKQTYGEPDIGIASHDQAFLTLFVTIEPPLQPSRPLVEKFETSEDERLIDTAFLWIEDLKKKFPKREYKVLATDLNGKKVFLTRYICDQIPPTDFGFDPTKPSQNSMDIICRYVSLIPYISDSVAFPDLCDLWSTSDQFLQMLGGDKKEHAVLLCNYFLWLGTRAWLVIGTGIPEGSTAYVLSYHQGVYQLWNAHTGEKFSVTDVYCPLQNIACLINNENIWANVQLSGQPCRISFDLTQSKLWKPFFTKKYPNPGLSSVQNESLQYATTDPQYVFELQEKIEHLLRDKIMEWRSHFVTRWNRYCSQSFRDLLVNMEHTYRQRKIHDHKAELNQVLSSYKLSGFPLHMAFTDINPVINIVHSTGVHLTEDPNVEFALAVHIHPYPGNVLSLWIYVATLTRKIRYY